MSEKSKITKRQRHILVAAAGKLTASSTTGERETIFERINGELEKLGISWTELFEKALPHPEPENAPANDRPDLMAAVDAMMAGFAKPEPRPAPPRRRRHLSGDEIPRTVSGTIGIIDERDWRGGRMMFVQVTSDDFVYGPMVIFQETSQEVARTAGGDDVVIGRVDHPHDTARSPVLHGLTAA